ncbi:rod shape-determining protein MreC [Algoriphagus pacificus]|uniref:Cell shape-determining protein MreC n=1 Tax=Algoriphagus pacificus TaxID=2811234 RepID=A0ABS3CAG4_9BACT|nr:rod shape-determining protein MreC [Algoriphagus pacificus]MBN7814102.1 rod shape-determining protein MreC [Algoriphagus pacificus]
MLRILQFLYSLRSFLLFVLLEVVAIWLLVANNSPQGAAFFNSSNAVVGSVLETRSDISDFFSLAQANEALVVENARLLEQLKILSSDPDSTAISLDSALATNYEFIGARVISNSLRYAQNHLTINKGKNQGVKPGMGIFNESGVVGRVKSVSNNYAVGISLLNTGLLVSSKIKTNEVFGSINWDGKDSKKAKMLYVPRHVKAEAGDTVVTSGFNAVFPKGIKIGVISAVSQSQDPNYLDIDIELTTDFSKISYVYLVENNQIEELDSLYQQSEVPNEF